MCWMCADSLNTLMAENAIDSSSFKRADYWLNPSGNVHSAEISLHEKLPRPRCDTHTHTHMRPFMHRHTRTADKHTHIYTISHLYTKYRHLFSTQESPQESKPSVEVSQHTSYRGTGGGRGSMRGMVLTRSRPKSVWKDVLCLLWAENNTENQIM